MHRRLRYYILFSVGFALCWYLIKLGWVSDAGRALRSSSYEIVINIAALVFTVEWLMPRLFYRSKYIGFGVGLGLLVLLGGTGNIFFQLHLMGSNPLEYQANIAKYKDTFYYWFWSDLVAGSYFMILFVASGGFAVRLAFDRVLLSRRMANLEAEKLRSELESLKNQINPHFIFNALNTIYYKIDRSNGAARMLTQQFSALIRYQLYECNEPEVAIEKEIRFIENYVGLQRERSDHPVRISCLGFELMRGFTIPPHVLAPVVENCFKHLSRFGDRENFIELACSREEDRFLFRAMNTYDPTKKSDGNGIGLANIRKRLELLYGDHFTLLTGHKGHCFETSITLSLDETDLHHHR